MHARRCSGLDPGSSASDCRDGYEGDLPCASAAVARAVREARAAVSDEGAFNASAPFARLRQERGILSKAILPLVVDGNVVGIFALYAKELGYFDEAEMAFLGELASEIAFGIDHLEKAARLDYLAYYDGLTGLANQSLFVERLRHALMVSQGTSRKTAVFVLDIDRFKVVNDAYGRSSGDELLR